MRCAGRLRGSWSWVSVVAAVVAVGAGCEGCSDQPLLVPLGQPCTIFCAPGLGCGKRGFCEKSCVCDGGPACVPITLAQGCPPAAVCVVTRDDGSGECYAVCGGAEQSCPPGQSTCAAGPEGTLACVGADFHWVLPDGWNLGWDAASDAAVDGGMD